MTRVALIGLGEVGRVFAEDLTARGVEDLVAYDVAFADPASQASLNATELNLAPASSAETAVAAADLVVCAVTASSCSAAAVAAASGFGDACWFFDLNSSSPGQKRKAQAAVTAQGGRYVEAALMSPIATRRLGSPFLLGGPWASEFARAGGTWGLSDLTVFAEEVGRAAAAKLCRSVIVKGLESLFTESMLAARSYGVETVVLDSLSNVLPPADWEAVAAYFMSRSLRHGQRRSEEMTEAAATLEQAGVEPVMALATARRQAWAAAHADAASQPDLVAMVDLVLETRAAMAAEAATDEARA